MGCIFVVTHTKKSAGFACGTRHWSRLNPNIFSWPGEFLGLPKLNWFSRDFWSINRPKKLGGWETTFLLGKPIFRGLLLREGHQPFLITHVTTPKMALEGGRQPKSGQCLKILGKIWAFYNTPPKNDQFGPWKMMLGRVQLVSLFTGLTSLVQLRGVVFLLTKDYTPAIEESFPY